MNIGQLASRLFCSGPFSFALGFGVGILAMYLLDKAKEERKLGETQREIEALIKALEAKAKQEAKGET